MTDLPKETDKQKIANQWNYAIWRFNTWQEGFGTYEEIDKAVEEGRLIPGKDWKEE